MLYLAYGSNLNHFQMSTRCPDAVPLEKYYLQGYKLEFRLVATIVKSKKNDSVSCGLWKITENCEKSLDIYEGHPKVYRKEFINLKDGRRAMTYLKNNGNLESPSQIYYNTILKGYEDFGLPLKNLEMACKG